MKQKMMRSMCVTGPFELEDRQAEVPVPKAGEALIRIAYTGICGSDTHAYMGHVPTIKKDVVLGHEYSGKLVMLS